MSSFMHSMDTMNGAGKHLGENGTPEHDDMALPPALALFNASVRGVERARLADLARRLVRSGPDGAADLAVLVMQLRDVRGGKGERRASLALLCEMARHTPKAAAALVPLLPHYGCWRDMLALIDEEHAEAAGPPAAAAAPRVGSVGKKKTKRAPPGLPASTGPPGPLGVRALDAFAAQLRADAAADEGADVSLAGKWAPRAGHHWDVRAKDLARRLFPDSKAAAADYRKLIARLAARVACPERDMCAGRFAAIHFAKVPARAMSKHRNAFLNETADGAAPTAAQDATGNRRPDDADRVACRKRLRAAVRAGDVKKVKGARAQPHELVREFLGGRPTSTLAADVVDVQWRSLVDDTRAQLLAAAGGGAAEGAVNLGRMVALVDVSGSMSGTPMEAAIALGLLVQELAAPAFRGRVLTFTSTPQWVAVPARGVGGATLKDAVGAVKRAPWGGSTDIAAALERVLAACEAARCAPDDVPELLVLSDMQFDSAHAGGAWETAHERLVRRFAETGERVCGAPWPAPTVTYWNLRGDTRGHAARADLPGVRLLSGFSPSLLKLVLSGAAPDGDGEKPDGAARGGAAAKPTPWATLRTCLDDTRYDAVRAAVAACARGDDADAALRGYTWAAPATADEAEELTIAMDEDDDAVLVDMPRPGAA